MHTHGLYYYEQKTDIDTCNHIKMTFNLYSRTIHGQMLGLGAPRCGIVRADGRAVSSIPRAWCNCGIHTESCKLV